MMLLASAEAGARGSTRTEPMARATVMAAWPRRARDDTFGYSRHAGGQV